MPRNGCATSSTDCRVDVSGSGLDPLDRRALLSVAVQFFVNGAVFASFVPRLPEIRDRIDITLGTLGALLAVAGVVGLAGSASVGALISTFGSRRVMIWAAVGLTVSLAVVGLANTLPVLLIGLIGLATLDVLVDSAMNLQGSWISGRRTVPVMNRLHGLWSLGTVVGGLVASQVAGAGVSLQTHLLFVAVLMFAVVVFVGRGLLRRDEHATGVADPGSGSVPDTSDHAGPIGEPRVGSRVDPGVGPSSGADIADRRPNAGRFPLFLLAIAGGCSIAMEQTSSDWAAFRLTDDFAATAGVAGLAYVAFTVGMTTGRFGGDWAVARFGEQRVFRTAIVVTLVALAIASLAPNRWIVLAAYVVAGLGIATQFPKLYDDAARHPGRSGAGLGALTGGSKIALLATPVIVGSLAATSLSVGSATAIVTLPAAIGFVLISRRSRPMPRAVGST